MLSRETIYYLLLTRSGASRDSRNTYLVRKLYCIADFTIIYDLLSLKINRNLTFVSLTFLRLKFNRIRLRIIFIRDFSSPQLLTDCIDEILPLEGILPGCHRSRPKIYFGLRQTFATNLNKTIMKAEFDRRELNGNSWSTRMNYGISLRISMAVQDAAQAGGRPVPPTKAYWLMKSSAFREKLEHAHSSCNVE